MLTIRALQIEAFRTAAEQRFQERMAGCLRSRFPEETRALDDVDLRTRLNGELEVARGFGIEVERDLALYLVLGITYGPGFIDRGEHAWMRGYLTDPAAGTPGERMRRLYQAVIRNAEQHEANQRARDEYAAASR